MSEKIVLVAVAMIFAGVTITVFCLGVIHGAVYGLLAAGISLVFLGVWIGCAPWDKIK